mgnify:FL=1
MFLNNPCTYPGCKRNSISCIDKNGNLIENSQFCYKHTKEPEKAKNDLLKYISENQKIVGLNCSGITFSKSALGGHRFYGCDFSHCFFSELDCVQIHCRMCKFDFTVFTDCNLIQSNMQFCSFAGTKLIHVLFTGSDLIQDNFNGLSSYQSSFDDSDLYNSRFIRSHLVDTSIRNCNIKKTVFFEAQTNNVSFKLSNTNEAIFDKRGSALFTGDAEENSLMNTGAN